MKKFPIQKNIVELVANNNMQDFKIILERDLSPKSKYLNDIQPIKLN